jgi:hypothetical protein
MVKQAAYLFGFLIVCFVTFATAERTFSPVFQQCIDKHDHVKKDGSANDKPASIGSVGVAYVACSGDFVDSHGSGISALATLIIAFFTCTLWVATSTQARLTKEALIADKRAFIFADGFIQNWETGAAPNLYNWRFRPRWRNTGSTPPRRLTTHVECEIRNTILPKGYAFNHDNGQIGTGLIPPHAETFGGIAPQGAAITPQDIVEAEHFRRFIYLWGWTKYFDVFPETPEHITHFCWLITIVGDPMAFVPNTLGAPPTPGALAFSYIQHGEGNYTDET